MTPIDRNTWPRKEIFDFFSPMSHPFFSVTFKQDVTNLYNFAKQQNISFYYALTYLSAQAINSVEAFRYLLKDDQLYLSDGRSPSFTDMHPGSDQFHIVTMPLGNELVSFCQDARARSISQTAFIELASEADDLIYISCLPWVELTALTNERNFDKNDSIPRLAWGKYAEENGRKTLHISMELNHRFVDGVHVGKFHKKLTELIATL